MNFAGFFLKRMEILDGGKVPFFVSKILFLLVARGADNFFLRSLGMPAHPFRGLYFSATSLNPGSAALITFLSTA